MLREPQGGFVDVPGADVERLGAVLWRKAHGLQFVDVLQNVLGPVQPPAPALSADASDQLREHLSVVIREAQTQSLQSDVQDFGIVRLHHVHVDCHRTHDGHGCFLLVAQQAVEQLAPVQVAGQRPLL